MGSFSVSLGLSRLDCDSPKLPLQRSKRQSFVQSSDLVAIEDLKVRNMVKNHHLAKSISDVAWTLLREWLEYFGKVFDVPVIAVAPHYTSQDCSNCGHEVKKALSTRTHKCPHCDYIEDRDTNAAINILMLALAGRDSAQALQGLAQLPSGRRKVTPGDEMTHCSDGETLSG